jgi:hypothetical protein
VSHHALPRLFQSCHLTAQHSTALRREQQNAPPHCCILHNELGAGRHGGMESGRVAVLCCRHLLHPCRSSTDTGRHKEEGTLKWGEAGQQAERVQPGSIMRRQSAAPTIRQQQLQAARAVVIPCVALPHSCSNVDGFIYL